MRLDLTTCRDPDLLAAEVRRLRAAITALADQDATLSVCEGRVIVTMDATLTVEERAAIEGAMWDYGQYADEMGLSAAEATERQATLRGLLERTK